MVLEVHFARCAAVAEYSLLAALAAHPPGRRLRPWMAAVAVIVAALLTGYGLWRTWSVAEVEPRLARSPASPASGQLQSGPAPPVMDTHPDLPLRSPHSPLVKSPVAVTPEPAGDTPSGLLLNRESSPLPDRAANMAAEGDSPPPPLVAIMGGIPPRRSPPLPSFKAMPPGRRAASDCLLKILLTRA
jgi:hypothetical protein